MFRFNRWVCALAVCLAVGAVYAKAIKVKQFDFIHVENPDGDGMAIANYHQGNGRTEITAAITGFLPDTNYRVYVRPGIDFPTVTNSAGNATSHGFVTFDICGWENPEVCLIVWRDLDGDTFQAADGSEDRAMGCTPCP